MPPLVAKTYAINMFRHMFGQCLQMFEACYNYASVRHALQPCFSICFSNVVESLRNRTLAILKYYITYY